MRATTRAILGLIENDFKRLGVGPHNGYAFMSGGKVDSEIKQAVVDSVENKWGSKLATMSADEIANVTHNWATIHGDLPLRKPLESRPDLAATARAALTDLLKKHFKEKP